MQLFESTPTATKKPRPYTVKDFYKYKFVTEPVIPYGEGVKLSSSRDAYEVLYKEFQPEMNIREIFCVLSLSASNKVTGIMRISEGSTRATLVDPKLIGKFLCDKLAQSCIIAHNHPSGNLRPSEADITMTKKIAKGLAFLEIKLNDHIIITEDAYYSFSDEGMMY